MGHDISAYLGDNDPADLFDNLSNWSELPEIAELCRNASNPLRHTIYEVLDATDYEGNVSGIWAARWFNRQQLNIALTLLNELFSDGLDVERENKFVRDCLYALPDNRDCVFVTFG